MGVTVSSRCRVRAGASLIEWVHAADLVEKSEAEGRKLRRASISSRSVIDGGRVLRFGSAVTSSIGGLPAPGRAEPGLLPGTSAACMIRLPHQAQLSNISVCCRRD